MYNIMHIFRNHHIISALKNNIISNLNEEKDCFNVEFHPHLTPITFYISTNFIVAEFSSVGSLSVPT